MGLQFSQGLNEVDLLSKFGAGREKGQRSAVSDVMRQWPMSGTRAPQRSKTRAVSRMHAPDQRSQKRDDGLDEAGGMDNVQGLEILLVSWVGLYRRAGKIEKKSAI